MIKLNVSLKILKFVKKMIITLNYNYKSNNLVLILSDLNKILIFKSNIRH